MEVERDGKSFAHRTVRSLQGGAAIFILTASFHKPEPSSLTHGMSSPIDLVPTPETTPVTSSDDYAKEIYQKILKASVSLEPDRKVPSIIARAQNNAEGFIRSLSAEFASLPIDFRRVSNDMLSASATQPTDYRQYVWFKSKGQISRDAQIHSLALAYASDFGFLNTSIRAHRLEWNFRDISAMSSLDHIIYFHDVCSLRSEFINCRR